MKIGRIVTRRDEIRAEDHNELVEELDKILNVRAGPGIVASINQNGLDIAALDTEDKYLVPARTMSHTGADPDLRNNIKYTVQAIGNPDCKLVDVIPAFGSPVKGADVSFTKIRPARDGSFCFILWDIDAEGVTTGKLVLFQGGSDGECVFFEPCSTSASPALGDDGDQPAGAGQGLVRSLVNGALSLIGF